MDNDKLKEWAIKSMRMIKKEEEMAIKREDYDRASVFGGGHEVLKSVIKYIKLQELKNKQYKKMVKLQAIKKRGNK